MFRESHVLLVLRRRPPNEGRWSVPGGALELGETVEQAVVRETREETGVEVQLLSVVSVDDYIEREANRIRWHYVLIDVLCTYLRGEPFPMSDASSAGFIEMRDLGEFDLVPLARGLIERAATGRRRVPTGPDRRPGLGAHP